jgi:hypothetical protein
MKDIHKNPILYYVLVPVIVGLWPLLVWTVYLPRAEANWNSGQTQYAQAQEVIEEILSIDPDRLEFAAAGDDEAEFEYARDVDRVARMCNIRPGNFSVNARPPRTSRGQKSQTALVALEDVDISSFAQFLSTMQLRWANLQCTQVDLTKKKGQKDKWDADLDFKYYY